MSLRGWISQENVTRVPLFSGASVNSNRPVTRCSVFSRACRQRKWNRRSPAGMRTSSWFSLIGNGHVANSVKAHGGL